MTILEISPTSFTVSWRPPLGEEKGETLYYLVNVTDTEGERVVFLEHKVNDITIPLQVEELLPGRVYQASVAVASRDGVGSSATVFIRTSMLTNAGKHTRALICIAQATVAWACFVNSRLNKLILEMNFMACIILCLYIYRACTNANFQ